MADEEDQHIDKEIEKLEALLEHQKRRKREKRLELERRAKRLSLTPEEQRNLVVRVKKNLARSGTVDGWHINLAEIVGWRYDETDKTVPFFKKLAYDDVTEITQHCGIKALRLIGSLPDEHRFEIEKALRGKPNYEIRAQEMWPTIVRLMLRKDPKVALHYLLEGLDKTRPGTTGILRTLLKDSNRAPVDSPSRLKADSSSPTCDRCRQSMPKNLRSSTNTFAMPQLDDTTPTKRARPSFDTLDPSMNTRPCKRPRLETEEPHYSADPQLHVGSQDQTKEVHQDEQSITSTPRSAMTSPAALQQKSLGATSSHQMALSRVLEAFGSRPGPEPQGATDTHEQEKSGTSKEPVEPVKGHLSDHGDVYILSLMDAVQALHRSGKDTQILLTIPFPDGIIDSDEAFITAWVSLELAKSLSQGIATLRY